VRILYFADIRFPLERANGIQTMETCHALASRGHEVGLVVRPDTHSPPRDPFEYYGLSRTPRLTVERAPIAGPQFARRIAYLSFATGRAIGADRADVVLTRDLGTAAVLAKVPHAVRAPLIYESHGYAPEVAAALPGMVTGAPVPGHARLKRLAKREAAVWHGADGYITITAALARLLQDKFGQRLHTAVVPDGVRMIPAGDWHPLPEEDPPNVTYAGHLYPWKGVDVLLEALARTPHVRGSVVGGHKEEGDRARLESLATRLGISERVTFVGHVAPAHVHEVLRQATILVLPNPASAISTHFTSPLKLFEYMAAGRAIVASDLPAIREVLEHERNALLVRPGDPGALATAIERLAYDRDLASQIARRAFHDASEYTWDRRAQRLEALFEDVLTPR
jgi:glycosyltransferase involved in cell wall biosynthesis